MAVIEPYCRLINNFVNEHGVTSICDLGCGDFYVASQYINNTVSCNGIDIVQKMIDHHNHIYASDNVSFQGLDIVKDDLPDAELCLVRQVLQHLSNEEVKQVLKRIGKYKYAIITEHVVEKKYAKNINIDKVHGNHTRVEKRSGLYLDEKPFNLKIETLLDIPLGKNNERMVTVLVKREENMDIS